MDWVHVAQIRNLWGVRGNEQSVSLKVANFLIFNLGLGQTHNFGKWIERIRFYRLSENNIQRDSKRWTHFVNLYGLNSNRRLNTRQTVGCGIPSSLLALRVDLRGLRSKLS